MMDQIELLGFPLESVFSLAAENAYAYKLAIHLPDMLGKEVKMLLYFVTNKPVRTISRTTMYFGTFLDADGNWVDTVHFPESSHLFPFQGKGFYRVIGKVVEEFGIYSVEVSRQEKVGFAAT